MFDDGARKVRPLGHKTPGNAHASYECYEDIEAGQRSLGRIKLQDGPVKEVGVKGWTNEALLAVVQHRLEGFQSGDYPCEENADALESIKAAQKALSARKAKRVEGAATPATPTTSEQSAAT